MTVLTLLFLLLFVPDPTSATVWIASDYPALTQILAAVQPGDTVQLADGLWQHATDTSRDYIVLAKSGTASAPITLTAAPGTHPIVRGRGFEDRDLNNDGLADGPIGTTNEALLRITGQYWIVSGLRFTNSNRWGVYLGGNHNKVLAGEVDNNWDAGVTIDGNFNTVSIEAHHNRHGSGIIIRPGAGRTANGNIIQSCFSHENGYQPDGTVVLKAQGDTAGGGNADGFTAFKGCYDLTTPGHNFCVKNTVSNNVFWHNADDGVDVSFADSTVQDNISIDNSSPGNGPNGFKVFLPAANINFLHNLSYQDYDGFAIRSTGGKIEGNIALFTRHGGGLWIAQASPDGRITQNLAVKTATKGFQVGAPCAAPICQNNWTTDGTGDRTLP